MRSGASWHDVCILNLSLHGAGIQALEPPARGSYVEIRRGSHVIIAASPGRRGIVPDCARRTRSSSSSSSPSHAAGSIAEDAGFAGRAPARSANGPAAARPIPACGPHDGVRLFRLSPPVRWRWRPSVQSNRPSPASIADQRGAGRILTARGRPPPRCGWLRRSWRRRAARAAARGASSPFSR